MLKDISTLLKISRSMNNPKDKMKSEKKNHSLERSKDPIIFEDEYTFYFPKLNKPI